MKISTKLPLILQGAFITFLVLLLPHAGKAQHDSSYYVSYPRHLTTRFYFSQKYTSLTDRSTKDKYTLNYLPNTTTNMGVGATFRSFTLNLAYGFPFLNQEPEKGKTRYIDLQFHTYGEKFNLDVLGQFYKGFYLNPKDVIQPGYYLRPDLRVNIVGASYQYVLNHKRFSFRASVHQNEWQKRSAGTVLAGIEMYTGRITSDSTLVPTAFNAEVASTNEHRTGFFEMGPNVGYAYTWVVQQHFFLTGSFSLGLDLGVSHVTTDRGTISRVGFAANNFFRLATGYNSADWAFSIVYVNNGVRLVSQSTVRETVLNSGNLKLNIVHRFKLSTKEERVLRKVIK